MRIGSLVKLIHQPIQKQVEEGALAIVVDGRTEFPDLYTELISRVGIEQVTEFIWVRWIKKDARWHGQPDGAYAEARFINVRQSAVVNSNRRALN